MGLDLKIEGRVKEKLEGDDGGERWRLLYRQ